MPAYISLNDLYCTIEQMKNGLFTVTKYEGAIFCGPAPHIFIFANNLPKMHALSKDRWAVYRIGHISRKLYLCSDKEIRDFIKDRIDEEKWFANGGDQYLDLESDDEDDFQTIREKRELRKKVKKPSDYEVAMHMQEYFPHESLFKQYGD